jgi:hypothetical protein
MAACGVHAKRITEVGSFAEYSQPLLQVLESVPDDERVILVGHSFGGLSLALAMEIAPLYCVSGGECFWVSFTLCLILLISILDN